MPLLNYTPLVDEIKIGENGENGTLVVRGIGFPEIAQLIEVHAATIAPLFDRATGKDETNPLTMTDIDAIPYEMIRVAPAAVAHLIALAADENVTVISTLPLDVQFEALVKIGKLTFKSVGGAENFLKAAAEAMASVSGLAAENKKSLQASMNGLKASKEIVPS